MANWIFLCVVIMIYWWRFLSQICNLRHFKATLIIVGKQLLKKAHLPSVKCKDTLQLFRQFFTATFNTLSQFVTHKTIRKVHNVEATIAEALKKTINFFATLKKQSTVVYKIPWPTGFF